MEIIFLQSHRVLVSMDYISIRALIIVNTSLMEAIHLKCNMSKPSKVLELTKEPYNFKVRRIYLGTPKESELWLKCASVLFNCDPEELRKSLINE
jgi:hypothetical protein